MTLGTGLTSGNPGGGGSSGGGAVSSFNTRTGAVVLSSSDLTALITQLAAGSSHLVVGGTTLAPTVDLSSADKTTLAAALQSLAAGNSTITIGGTATAPTVSVATGGVTNTQISGSAAIALSKLANPGANTLIGDTNGGTTTGAITVGTGLALSSGTLTATGGGSGVSSVTATDASIVISGTAGAPTVATGTLDVVATQHPPAANWSNNSKKITSLANGSGAQDAAAFGQIPTSAGTIGGMLTATYDPAAIAQQVVGTTATQTLTNKTLTSPVVSTISNTGTLTLPTSTDTLTGRATTDTLTNKRITKRVLALSSNSATPTINTDSYDVVHITSQTAAITSFTTNLSGTPNDGDTVRISITGTASVGITWGSKFESSTVTLPSTTSGTTRLDMGFVWNTETSAWRCVAVA